MKKRALSGIRCSGILHIGNYLGALKQWIDRQNEFDNTYFIADLHTITTPISPKDLNNIAYSTLAVYLACGVDPKKSTVFLQSQMPQHPELGWILNCITHMGELRRMTQFKDKSEKGGVEQASVGLFDYPVLMAADILIYQADVVPVGEDQAQHVEFARALARRFNNKYGQVFKIPEVLIKKEAARIMALDNPQKKMSKTAESEYNYITLIDKPEDIRKKISKAVTDSQKGIRFDPARKGLYNLLTIYQLLSESRTPTEIEKKFSGKGYGEFKKALAELIIGKLSPIQQKYNKLITDKAYLNKVLVDGKAKATKIAEKTLKKVKQKVGFVLK